MEDADRDGIPDDQQFAGIVAKAPAHLHEQLTELFRSKASAPELVRWEVATLMQRAEALEKHGRDHMAARAILHACRFILARLR